MVLLHRDLGGKKPAPQTMNWKQSYKDEYLLEKKQRGINTSNLGLHLIMLLYFVNFQSAEVSRTIRVPRLPQSFFPTPRVYPDGMGGHEFPGMVGGYSDLYPDLRGIAIMDKLSIIL